MGSEMCIRDSFLRLQGNEHETERPSAPSPSLLDMLRADEEVDDDPRKAPSPLKDTYRGQ